MSSLRRPPSCCCTRRCPKKHHLAVRRFLSAVDELLRSGEALLALPEPANGAESLDHWGVRQDVYGLLWAARITDSATEGAYLSCCHADRRVAARAA